MKSTIILLVSLSVAYVCALEDIRVNSRIFNGRPAEKGELPYQVALALSKEKYSFCGGSLIDDKWVLTAAHCFWGTKEDKSVGYKRKAAEVVVIPGGQIDITTPDARASRMKVDDVIVHPDYDPTNYENDIALVKVEQGMLMKAETKDENGNMKLVFESKLIPYAEEIKGDFLKAYPAFISGYGRVDEHFNGKVLNMGKIKFIPDSECEGYYTKHKMKYKSDKMMCVGDMDGENMSGACKGDSGGPLVVEDGKGLRVVVGVGSAGPSKCGSGNYAVYTRVTEYYPFIKGVLDGKIKEGKKEE